MKWLIIAAYAYVAFVFIRMMFHDRQVPVQLEFDPEWVKQLDAGAGQEPDFDRFPPESLREYMERTDAWERFEQWDHWEHWD